MVLPDESNANSTHILMSNKHCILCHFMSACSCAQVKVLFAGQDINNSPFLVNVSKALGDPNKVQARGPGLEPVGNVANKPTYFDIYTAGQGPE